jgi:hypothetical protein
VGSALVNLEFDFNMASGTDDSHFREEDLGHEHYVFQSCQNYTGLPEALPQKELCSSALIK